MACSSIFLNLELLFCEIFTVKNAKFCFVRHRLYLHKFRRKKHNVLPARTLRAYKLHTVLNIGWCYMICLAICNRKTICEHILKFCSAFGGKICSVNLDRGTTFLTLDTHALTSISRPPYSGTMHSKSELVAHS